MKSKKTIMPDWDELMPTLVDLWRHFHKISGGGPADRLHTREFRHLCGALNTLLNKDCPDNAFEDRKLLGADFLYNFPIHYAEGLSLIGELPHTPKRVLDVASGCAPYSLAALRHGATDVTAIDRCEAALRLGAQVCGRLGYAFSQRLWKGPQYELPVDGYFDLIVVGHALGELFPSTSQGWQIEQMNFIASLLDRLTPSGFLLLVDSSLPDANQRLIRIRDELVKGGIAVQAPCIYQGLCPVANQAKSPCYAQRELTKPYLIQEIQRACQINRSSLKMTYHIFKAPNSAWPVLPQGNLARIISPPAENVKGRRFYLCGTQGKTTLDSNLKETPVTAKAFDYLRRGDMLSYDKVTVQGEHAHLGPDSVVQIAAACGKAVDAE